MNGNRFKRASAGDTPSPGRWVSESNAFFPESRSASELEHLLRQIDATSLDVVPLRQTPLHKKSESHSPCSCEAAIQLRRRIAEREAAEREREQAGAGERIKAAEYSEPEEPEK